jgi:hypothetical protein
MKLASVLLAAGVSLAATPLFAGQQLTEMSDQQMDQVAAGSLNLNNVANNTDVLSNNQVAVNAGTGEVTQHQYIKQMNSGTQKVITGAH